MSFVVTYIITGDTPTPVLLLDTFLTSLLCKCNQCLLGFLHHFNLGNFASSRFLGVFEVELHHFLVQGNAVPSHLHGAGEVFSHFLLVFIVQGYGQVFLGQLVRSLYHTLDHCNANAVKGHRLGR